MVKAWGRAVRGLVPWSVVGLVVLVSAASKGCAPGPRDFVPMDGAEAGQGNGLGGDGAASGGGGPGSGGASGGSGGTGGDATGGAGTGGSPPEPAVIGAVGEPCATEGGYGCAGYDQRAQLRCEDGEWAAFDQCNSDERCDTRESNAGLCEPIEDACESAEPGAAVACSGNTPQLCGPDRVTLTNGAPCGSDTGCLEGACEPVLEECVGRDVGDEVCSADGTEAFSCGPNLVTRDEVEECAHWCSQGACVTPPSCVGLAATCGPNGNGDCCASPLVTGGTFFRGETADYPATVSDFRLDKYEVTVGRFEKYVAATIAGWLPSAGSGKHTHLNEGAGLSATGGGSEPGWDASWNVEDSSHRMYSGPSAGASWDSSLLCNSAATWTSASAEKPSLPINCVNWYQAAAFCIWDGGFLPSDAEWEYAAAGGDEERTYPWGEATPDCTFAEFSGCGDTGPDAVGAFTKGDGRWGQSDLAVNLAELVLDWFVTPPSATCNDCTNATASTNRAERAGSYSSGSGASGFTAATRYGVAPDYRSVYQGFRCARVP